MNIIVFKPDYRPINQEFKVEAREHPEVKGRKNIVIPVDKGNQHFFALYLLKASYSIFNFEKELEFGDIKIRNYRIITNRNLEEYMSSKDFQTYSQIESFVPVKNLTSERSETLDKAEKKTWFKNILLKNYRHEPLRKSPIISSTDSSGRYELTLYQLFDSTAINPAAFAIGKESLLQSPIFYLQALDLKIDYKVNIFEDDSITEKLDNFDDTFKNLGLQIKIREYLNRGLPN